MKMENCFGRRENSPYKKTPKNKYQKTNKLQFTKRTIRHLADKMRNVLDIFFFNLEFICYLFFEHCYFIKKLVFMQILNG